MVNRQFDDVKKRVNMTLGRYVFLAHVSSFLVRFCAFSFSFIYHFVIALGAAPQSIPKPRERERSLAVSALYCSAAMTNAFSYPLR